MLIRIDSDFALYDRDLFGFAHTIMPSRYDYNRDGGIASIGKCAQSTLAVSDSNLFIEHFEQRHRNGFSRIYFPSYSR